MLNRWDVQARVRLVGLWASIVAVVAVGVTVLADNHTAGFGRVIPREEEMVLLLIATLLFAVQAIAYLVHRSRRASRRALDRTPSDCAEQKTDLEESRGSEFMHQIIETIEGEVNSQPSPIEFEMAYQARVAIDRSRFAIKHTEQFAPGTEAMREAGLQLLDALARLEIVDRRFQQRFSKSRSRPHKRVEQRGDTEWKWEGDRPPTVSVSGTYR